MNKTPPSLRSLEARIRNLAHSVGVAERRVRRLVGIVVIGQLLSRTNTAVIKGATNLELRLGTSITRVSSDLDTVRTSTLNEFRDQLGEALLTGWEGFTGVLADNGEIAIPAPDGYRPHSFLAKLRFRGKPFVTVIVEVSPDEIRSLQTKDIVAMPEIKLWFDTLGLPQPAPVPTLTLAHQIAQKLHACSLPDAEGWINERAHDLVDLQLAMKTYEGALAEIRAIATRLFVARHRHKWPPTITIRAGWEIRYAAAAIDLDVLQRLDEAVIWANQLVSNIDTARK